MIGQTISHYRITHICGGTFEHIHVVLFRRNLCHSCDLHLAARKRTITKGDSTRVAPPNLTENLVYLIPHFLTP